MDHIEMHIDEYDGKRDCLQPLRQRTELSFAKL
jgi:hypothetical protein